MIAEYEAGIDHEISENEHRVSSKLYAWKTPFASIERAIVLVGYVFWTDGKKSFRARIPRCNECGGEGFLVGNRDVTIPINAHAMINCVKGHEWKVYAHR